MLAYDFAADTFCEKTKRMLPHGSRSEQGCLPSLLPVIKIGWVAKPQKKIITKADAEGIQVVAQNRAASYNFNLLEKFEAGMALSGTEVKSLRAGRANLRDAYAEVRGGSVWLVNCHISQYLPGGPFNHEPLSKRRLLLHKSEIERLAGKTQQKGLTIVPLRIYFRKGLAKCELALAKGKKDWDRRQAEREKETRREVDEAMYKYRRR